jgi:hypothetical protein
MAPYDPESFSAGQETGARVAACLARLAALQLLDEARWWNRGRRRLMARALVAHAEEVERLEGGGEAPLSGAPPPGQGPGGRRR